jgi:hypothetical protein
MTSSDNVKKEEHTMKRLKILLTFGIAAIMIFTVGCGREQGVTGGYTWLRSGETLTEDGLRFSVEELNNIVINSIHSRVTIETHSGNDIIIEYVPNPQGSGNIYHHTIRPRYEFAGGNLEIFRDVSLAPNTFVLGNSINILVPIYDGLMFESVSITTTFADIVISNSRVGGQLSARTTHAEITVTNVDIENNLVLQTELRDIDINNSRVGGQLSASTTANANIKVTNVDTDIDNAELYASYGDVIIE